MKRKCPNTFATNILTGLFPELLVLTLNGIEYLKKVQNVEY